MKRPFIEIKNIHTHESYLRPEEVLVFVVLLPEDSLLFLLLLDVELDLTVEVLLFLFVVF